MIKTLSILILAAVLSTQAAHAGPGQLSACAAGQLTCINDSANNQVLQGIAKAPDVQQRIFLNYLGQCQSVVYQESGAGSGHAQRAAMCGSISAEKLPMDMLVMDVFAVSPTVQAQALCPEGTSNQGCMVDADINAAIATILTIGPGGGLATRVWP
jgi:hypothetical protein